jgi:hypothetical protein
MILKTDSERKTDSENDFCATSPAHKERLLRSFLMTMKL